VAAIEPKPKTRVHFPVKFAAGALRVASVLTLLGGVAIAYVILNLAQIPGAEAYALVPVAAVALSALAVGLAVVYTLILWGFADGLVLLADIDDAQRRTQAQLTDVVLAQRTERGPFHKEMVAAKTRDGAA